MAARSIGWETVRGQLDRIRRRHNAFVVAEAAARLAAALLAAAAALLVCAARGGPQAFALVFWSAAALVLAATWASLRQARNGWLGIEEAARLADEQGALEDRLSSLLATRRAGRPSRLAQVLLVQVLGRSRKWAPSLVVPARVPRSLALLAAAAAVLGMALRLGSPPGPPVVVILDGAGAPGTGARTPRPARPDTAVALAGRSGGEEAGAATGATAGGEKAGRGGDGAAGARALEPGRGAERRTAPRPADPLSASARRWLRRALGMGPERVAAVKKPGGRRGGSGAGRSPKTEAARRVARAGSTPPAPARSAGPSGGGRRGGARAAGGGAGSRDGAAAAKLFAASGTPAKPVPGRFVLRLWSAAPRAVEMQPQRASTPGASARGGASAARRTPPEVPASLGESPIYRLPPPPEDEALLRRLFSR